MTANSPQTTTARVRLEGTVTAVHADGRFTLKLPDGKELPGTAQGAQLRRLGKHLAREVVVLGTETADGTLTVDGVVPAQGPFRITSEDWPLTPSEKA